MIWSMGLEQVGYLAGIFVEGQGFGGWGQGLLSLYKSKIWGMGAGQRRRGAVLSIQSKNQFKAHF
jgi:hypothetical protein